MGKGLEQSFLQRYTVGQQAHEKMLNTIRYKRNKTDNKMIKW